MHLSYLALCVCTLLIAACIPVPIAPAHLELETAWGPAHLLAQTEQSAPVALTVDAGRVFAAWVGADERGVHHDARLLAAGLLAEPVTLPLPPVHPYAQQAYPSLAGNIHLLWLDANRAGVTELYTALISPALTVERGPTPVAAEINARRYAALPVGDGSLWVLWSGASLAEPTLFLSRVDGLGRPLPSTLLSSYADYPALAPSHDGQLYAFWLNTAEGRFHGSPLQESASFAPMSLGYGPDLAPGDQLQSVYAAADTSHLYLFWNIQGADGLAHSWLMTSPLSGWDWSAPQRLGLHLAPDAGAFETGFNSGAAQSASLGEAPLSHARPLSSPSDILPVAAQWGDQVGVVYFQAGGIVAAQAIAGASLLAAPALAVDQSRYLYLAWTQASAEGPAALFLASLQPLGN